jgi:4-hydroxy-2-oxoheptanedioate aldolase
MTLTVALIESRAGVDALDAILAVPGLDYVAIGANDLRLSLGAQSQPPPDAAFRALLANTHARIKSSGKPQVAVVADAAGVSAATTAGAQLIAIPDSVLLADGARALMHSARTGSFGAG